MSTDRLNLLALPLYLVGSLLFVAGTAVSIFVHLRKL